MSKWEGNDHCLDPETGVLKNKLGIRDQEKLNEAEASLSAWRWFRVFQRAVKQFFSGR